MTDAGDPEQGQVPPPPPPPPVPPGGWQAPAPSPPSAPPPAAPQPPPATYGAPAPAYPAAPPPAGYGQAPAYGQPQGFGYPSAPKNDGMAVAALVCGIVAIPFFCGIGLILGVLGLVFGIIAMRKIDRSGGMLTGRGMALAGAICGGVGVAINVIYWGAAILVAISDSSS
jgi:Domain of unknown function (DUF4190)